MNTQDNSRQHQVMAFAAICQAAEMVKTIARNNSIDDDLLKVMLKSLTYIDATTPEEIYGDNYNLNLGYRSMVKQLGNSQDKDIEVTRYVLGAITLERSLASRPKQMSQLGQRIEEFNRMLSHFDILDSNSVSNVASIYTDVISPLGRRIQVTGSPQFLTIESNQAKVRALLLCAIRAAVLWRQLGGKRRQLIFTRSALVELAQHNINRL
jgi:high frequency lysogenization protein